MKESEKEECIYHLSAVIKAIEEKMPFSAERLQIVIDVLEGRNNTLRHQESSDRTRYMKTKGDEQ